MRERESAHQEGKQSPLDNICPRHQSKGCSVKPGQPPDDLPRSRRRPLERELAGGALSPLLPRSQLALGGLCLQVGPPRGSQRKSLKMWLLRWGTGG